MGGLYKSFSLIATISFSYWTLVSFEKKICKDIRSNCSETKSKSDKEIIAKLKATITVENQFHRSYSMQNMI